MSVKKVFAGKLSRGDEAVFASKPGSSSTVKVVVDKVLSSGADSVEVRWVNKFTGGTVFEGLYRKLEEVEIIELKDWNEG